MYFRKKAEKNFLFCFSKKNGSKRDMDNSKCNSLNIYVKERERERKRGRTKRRKQEI